MYNLSYKAYNNKRLSILHSNINAAASIWNHIISLQKRYYKLYGGYINVYRMQRHIAKLRNKNDVWKTLTAQSTQEISERVNISYQRFFKKISKFPPKYKKESDYSSFVLKQDGWKIKDNVLTINNKKYKFIKTRDYENIKRIIVKRSNNKEIFFIIVCDIKPKNYERVGDATIGIDFGFKTFLTLSNGKEIKYPFFLKKDIEKIKKLNKKYSLKKTNSKNKEYCKMAIQKLHLSIRNKRSDYQWKLAHTLCSENKFISIEDIDFRLMSKKYEKMSQDLGAGSFFYKLRCISEKYGTVIQKVGRYYPSSKTCSCGVINNNLKLSDRVWTCNSCGTTHKRDLLAANNILTEGIRLYRTKCKSTL